jgi:transposase
MDISVLGIDLGKNSCSVVGLDVTGKVVVRRRMRRETVITYAASLPACVVAMEACCGAHHMGRALARQGHAVRLMSPEYVRPYVKAQKNDDRDAEAIAEAATRPTMRFVELKTEEQLDMQTLHRIRDQLVGDRTSLMNQIRSLLLERGYIVPQGRAKLAARLGEMLDGDEPVLGARIHRLVSDMRLRWIALDERIADLDAEFTQAARADERMRRLLSIPGIGALNATALVAAVGDARTFGRGRDLAAWLGLVPRQATTGGKPRLLGITKRGSRYLRKNLIQGARSSLPTMSKSDTRLGAWLRGQHRRRGAGGQDGAHRLGAAASRTHLRTSRASGVNEIGRCGVHRPDDVCGR